VGNLHKKLGMPYNCLWHKRATEALFCNTHHFIYIYILGSDMLLNNAHRTYRYLSMATRVKRNAQSCYVVRTLPILFKLFVNKKKNLEIACPPLMRAHAIMKVLLSAKQIAVPYKFQTSYLFRLSLLDFRYASFLIDGREICLNWLRIELLWWQTQT
jgi:hypothetical protein